MDSAPAVLVILMLTFASAFSRINIGIRHVLVLYPFLALGAAYVTVRAWRALAAWRARAAGRNRRLAVAPVAVLLALLLWRSEEHTSELQSQSNLVCRLLLEKQRERVAEISVL